MNKVIKLNSLQSGSFSSTKNLLDFELPAKQLDLEKSYVNLVASTTSVDADSSTGEAVYNYDVKYDGSDISLPNVALVKHARLTSNQVPILEDIRRVDALRTQLHQYTNNMDDKQGQDYRKLFQPRNQGNIKLAPGIEFFGEGSTKSVVHNTNIQIPMKDIFELGKMRKYPGDKLGKSRVHLEMNFGKITTAQLNGTGSRTASDGRDFVATSYTTFENFAVNVGDIGTSANPFIMKEPLSDIKDSPYWVGQKLVFSGTKRTSGTPTGTVTVTALITNLELLTSGANEGKLAITMATRLTNLGANEDCIDITCDGVDATSITFTILEAEIVLEEVGQSEYENMDELEYSTYTNEGDNGSGLTNFSRQYSVEAEAFNLYVLPLTEHDILPVNSGSNRFESHRIMIDNEFVTNRDVETYSPLYYDQIGKTLLNGNMPLRNLTDVNKDRSAKYNNRFTEGKNLVNISTTMPMTPRRKQVQISIDGNGASGGVTKLELYKQVVRSIKL